MLLGIWKRGIVLLIFLLSNALGSFVGINIGTDISNLPSASTIVSILQAQKINHVRLFEADHQLLTALSNTGIEVMVGIPNDQLPQIGESKSAAAEWINKNISPYVPATSITFIAVGNEVLTSVPDVALVLVPAMQYIHSALLAANLDFQIHVSSPHSINLIPQFFPPSSATFNSTLNSIMHQYLQFLKNTGSSFMLNAEPYYSYTKSNGIYPIEYALFRSLNPDNQILDPNTLFSYTNMFDTMVDAAYYAMEALNFSGIPVIVTQTGWPSSGGDNESDANVNNALAYNTNLIRHVLNNSGTPSQPKMPINTYIYELFNEDLRPGPLSEKNWGIFFPNGTAVYSLNFVSGAADGGTISPGIFGVFCVANSSANSKDLRKGLDWACGPGGANCSLIQPGQPCYESGDLSAVASYAYDDYYHRAQASGGTCDFDNTAVLTTNDPSHGLCIFAGSTSNSTASEGPSSVSRSSTGVERQETLSSGYLVLLILLLFFYW